MVWDEAGRQARDMAASWSQQGTDGTKETTADTATLALHVLTCAGFGASYSFNEGVRKVAPGHEMTYRDSLSLCLGNIITFAIIPKRYLSFSFMPKKLQRLGQAVREFQQYMDEMLARERSSATTTTDQSRTANLMSALVRASDEASQPKDLGQDSKRGLTDEEIFGNIFAYNLAGHETTANTVAAALVLLAAQPKYQDWVRKEIKETQAATKGDYEAMFPRLQRCLAVMVSKHLLRFKYQRNPADGTTSTKPSASTAPSSSSPAPRATNPRLYMPQTARRSSSHHPQPSTSTCKPSTPTPRHGASTP